MTSEVGNFPYRSAAAFRAALRDRLTALARTGGHGLDELQRQVAYDRLLARAFTAPDADRWVLKGAGALLARLPEARHSRDVDLAFINRTTAPPDETQQAVDDAVASLRAAIDTDLGDFFRFEIQRTSPLQEAAKGRRIHLVAYLGARYATFHVDVVVGTAMTGTPQAGPPLTQLHIPGLLRPDYRLFPLPDHIADKLCAITEVHGQGDGATVSTRVKDLVDLILIAVTQVIDADALSLAVRVGTAHRALPLPPRFTVPDLDLWRRGYPARAKEAATAVPTSTAPSAQSPPSSTRSSTAPLSAPGTPTRSAGARRQIASTTPPTPHENRSWGVEWERILSLAPAQTNASRRRPMG